MSCVSCNKYRNVENFNFCPICGVKFRPNVNYIINPFQLNATTSTPPPKETRIKNISTNSN